MSITITRPQIARPLSAAAVTLTTGGASWENGDWVPLFTTDATTVLSGPVVRSSAVSTFAEIDCEIEIGAGAEGSEVAKGAWRYFGSNSGIGGPAHGPQPITPVGTFPAGTPLSVRLRGNQAETLEVSFRGHTTYDGDIADYDVVTLGGLPAAANMVTITPSGTEWEPSTWFPVGDELEVDTDIVALVMNVAGAAQDMRWELGRRLSGEGAPTYVTTFPSANTGGLALFSELPNYYPFNAGDQAYLRVLQSTTSVDDLFAAFMVFRHTPEVVPGQGTIGPLLWITIPFRPPVVT